MYVLYYLYKCELILNNFCKNVPVRLLSMEMFTEYSNIAVPFATSVNISDPLLSLTIFIGENNSTSKP